MVCCGHAAVRFMVARGLVLALPLATAPFVSCRQPARPPAPVEGWLHLTLAPAAFGLSVSLQQQVHVEAVGRTVDLDAALDIAPDAVTLVGLSLGQRMLTLRYDGITFTEQRHPMLPAEVRGADILTDVQLSLWPTAAVQSALPAGWVVRDDGTSRTLAQDGRDIVVITYEGASHWQGRLTMQNLRYNYRLVIRSVLTPP